MQQIFNPTDIFCGLKKKMLQQIRTVCIKGMIGIIFQHLITLIPTQGADVLTQAGELGGKAEEKQTQPRTEEEIPQGLSGIGEEVRRYL